MIANLKPYPAMKDSGVPWLGEVPEHWNVRKLKHLTYFHNGIAFKPSDWAHTGVPIIRIQNLNGSNQFNYTRRSDLPDFLRIRPGDLLFSWSGNRGTSFGPFIWNRNFEGYLNQHIFKLDGYSLDRRYFAHLLLAVTQHIEEQSHGIIGLVHVTKPELGAVLVPVALPLEQAAIVRFLDHYDRKIRRYIRVKQKLIKFLEEEKQAIIHHAVTRGLDPNIRLKPSGVEWIGDIPAHWGFNRGKYYFREVDVRSTTGIEELLSVSHITGVTPRSQKNINMFKAENYVGSKLCNPGQIAVNTMWAWMAAIGVSKYHGVISPSYHIYERTNEYSFHNEFLDLLLRSTPYKNLYTVHSTGITSSRLRLYPEDFLKIRFLCPPKNEQKAIVAWVGEATIDLNAVIDRTHREIDLLREYRTRLIADVVTGKLDVREAAAQLPEESDEPELLEEIEGQVEGEEEAEGPDLDMDPEEAILAN